MFDWNILLLGAGIGFISAVLGGIIEYQIGSKRREGEGGLPSCMLLVTGGLGFIGILVTGISWLVGREWGLPLVAGIGVGIGFFLGFIILLAIWILLFSRKSP